MAHPASNWYQTQLIPPDVIEFRLRFGVVPEQDHVQWLVEAFDPVTGAQISMISGPHGSLAGFMLHLDTAISELRILVESSVEPF